MKRYRTQLLTGCISGLFTLSIANAAPAPIITSTQGQAGHADSIGIGYTTSVASRPFIGVDNQSASLPYFSYANGDFYFEGLDIGYKFQKSHYWVSSLLVTPRFYEVKESFADNNELAGIEETKPTWFGGASAQLSTHFATYTFQLLSDLGESNGYEVVAQASKGFKPSADVTLIPSLGVTMQDKNLVAYYYGVQPAEVTSGRPEYTGGNSINVNATLNLIWNVTRQFQLLGQLKHETLGSGITDSPIVDEESINFITIGGVFRF